MINKAEKVQSKEASVQLVPHRWAYRLHSRPANCDRTVHQTGQDKYHGQNMGLRNEDFAERTSTLLFIKVLRSPTEAF